MKLRGTGLYKIRLNFHSNVNGARNFPRAIRNTRKRRESRKPSVNKFAVTRGFRLIDQLSDRSEEDVRA